MLRSQTAAERAIPSAGESGDSSAHPVAVGGPGSTTLARVTALKSAQPLPPPPPPLESSQPLPPPPPPLESAQPLPPPSAAAPPPLIDSAQPLPPPPEIPLRSAQPLPLPPSPPPRQLFVDAPPKSDCIDRSRPPSRRRSSADFSAEAIRGASWRTTELWEPNAAEEAEAASPQPDLSPTHQMRGRQMGTRRWALLLHQRRMLESGPGHRVCVDV